MNPYQRVFGFLALAIILQLTFNNCSVSRFGSNLPYRSLGGNGDSYDGKLVVYSNRNSTQVCQELQHDGRPLPDRQILRRDNALYLVRDNCADVPEQLIQSAAVTFNSDGTLIFGGKTFDAAIASEFGVLRSQCPAGTTPKANVARNNLLASGLDFSNASVWQVKNAMETRPSGVLAGLPASLVSRTLDATAEPWYRLSQFVPVDSTQTFVLSFYVRKDSSTQVRLEMFHNVPSIASLVAVWDLNTGALVNSSATSVTVVSTSSSPIAGGFFVTITFSLPAQTQGLDIGIAANDFGVGSSILATAMALEETSSFCQ